MDEKQILELGKIFLQTPEAKKIIAKAEGVVDAVEDFQMTKALIERYKPVVTTFSVRGRIYDEVKNEPLQGVKVKPQLALYPMKLVTKTRKVKIDDPNGEINRFTKKIKKIKLEGFAPAKQSLVTLAGEVPQDLPIVPMLNIEEFSKRKKEQVEDEVYKAGIKAAKILLDIAELTLLTIKSQILKFTATAQNKLLPLAIQLMVIFGITKLEKENQEEAVCPNNEALRALIKKRNSIVKQINQMWKVIAANTVIAGVLFYLSIQLSQIKLSLSSLPFPVSTPPGLGVPYFIISRLEKLQQLLDSFSNVSKELKKAIIMSLVFLVISLILILAYLRKVDELIEGCAAVDPPLPMDEVNAELLALKENSEQ